MLRSSTSLLIAGLLLGAQLTGPACALVSEPAGDAPAEHAHVRAHEHSGHHQPEAPPADATHGHDEDRDCSLLMACGTLAPPRVVRAFTAQVDERLDEHRTVSASPSSNAPDLELPPPRAA